MTLILTFWLFFTCSTCAELLMLSCLTVPKSSQFCKINFNQSRLSGKKYVFTLKYFHTVAEACHSMHLS